MLDLLCAHNGRTLNDLCEHLDMTRQGVTQHLDLLEAANLVATVRHGREKLHFLNPMPLQEIYERWIAKFERPRLNALSDLKQRLEKGNDSIDLCLRDRRYPAAGRKSSPTSSPC
ncbi:helix-turn-helix transcriptional regulator [Burkholderia sp. R-69927]|nr:helix-turn-helix transcriptional regulator [Burkholderia sp. R-69927]